VRNNKLDTKLERNCNRNQ